MLSNALAGYVDSFIYGMGDNHWNCFIQGVALLIYTLLFSFVVNPINA